MSTTDIAGEPGAKAASSEQLRAALLGCIDPVLQAQVLAHARAAGLALPDPAASAPPASEAAWVELLTRVHAPADATPDMARFAAGLGPLGSPLRGVAPALYYSTLVMHDFGEPEHDAATRVVASLARVPSDQAASAAGAMLAQRASMLEAVQLVPGAVANFLAHVQHVQKLEPRRASLGAQLGTQLGVPLGASASVAPSTGAAIKMETPRDERQGALDGAKLVAELRADLAREGQVDLIEALDRVPAADAGADSARPSSSPIGCRVCASPACVGCVSLAPIGCAARSASACDADSASALPVAAVPAAVVAGAVALPAAVVAGALGGCGDCAYDSDGDSSADDDDLLGNTARVQIIELTRTADPSAAAASAAAPTPASTQPPSYAAAVMGAPLSAPLGACVLGAPQRVARLSVAAPAASAPAPEPAQALSSLIRPFSAVHESADPLAEFSDAVGLCAGVRSSDVALLALAHYLPGAPETHAYARLAHRARLGPLGARLAARWALDRPALSPATLGALLGAAHPGAPTRGVLAETAPGLIASLPLAARCTPLHAAVLLLQPNARALLAEHYGPLTRDEWRAVTAARLAAARGELCTPAVLYAHLARATDAAAN